MLTNLIDKAKAKTLYGLKYSGYTVWWWGALGLSHTLGDAASKTYRAYQWSVRASNDILHQRTQLGLAEKDQLVDKEVADEDGEDFSNVEEGLLLDEERHNVS